MILNFYLEKIRLSLHSDTVFPFPSFHDIFKIFSFKKDTLAVQGQDKPFSI